MSFNVRHAETRLGEAIPVRRESTRTSVIPILANFRAYPYTCKWNVLDWIGISRDVHITEMMDFIKNWKTLLFVKLS